jgi:hypothetical protein
LAGLFAGDELQLANGRHQQDIAQVPNAGAGEVIVGEAHYRGVGVMVAGCAVLVGVIVAAVASVRGELNHPEWHGGAREGVAMVGGADQGFDVIGDCGAGQGGGREERSCAEGGSQTAVQSVLHDYGFGEECSGSGWRCRPPV